MFIFGLGACLNTSKKLDDIKRAKFRSPVLQQLYQESDLVVNGEIVKKEMMQCKVMFEDFGSVWRIYIKINRIFKNKGNSKLNENDTIITFVTCDLPMILFYPDSIGFVPDLVHTLPNLDNFNQRSICFFKKQSQSSKIYLEKNYSLNIKNEPWQYEWVDAFFPYYTPLDVASKDTLWGFYPLDEVIPFSLEHRYLKDLLGFPKYPEWQNPRDKSWNKYAPSKGK
jgi:hypothetical protein